jgi:hypothetical protein
VRHNIAEFRLGGDYGHKRLQLPVVEWGQVQTSMGVEKRPVVAISICLGSKLVSTPATLRDRSGMAYPFLVGRSALKGAFLVDPSHHELRSRIVPVQQINAVVPTALLLNVLQVKHQTEDST